MEPLRTFCTIFVMLLSVTELNGFLSGSNNHGCDLDCGAHGSCHYAFFKKACQCHDGYHGTHCEIPSACSSNPCHHQGRCEDIHSRPHFQCHCNFGYEGPTCEVSPCESHPCQNGGSCKVDAASNHFYTCDCAEGFNGEQCETAVMIVPPTTTTTTTSTTTVAPTTVMSTATCAKFSSVFDIAEKFVESNVLASVCPSGNHSSPEAYVLNNCHLVPPAVWNQGYNVMQTCRSLPTFTPVASFENSRYSSTKSLTGIFVGCLDDGQGFKMAVQQCDLTARLETIQVGGTGFNADANNYFTING